MFRRIQVPKKTTYLVIVFLMFGTYITYLHRIPLTVTSVNTRRYFAVFSCSTPHKSSYRGYDYAFYLPSTVLAWQRIGYESIILIIGERKGWKLDPMLSVTLRALDGMSDIATVIFLPTNDTSNLGTLSQISRLFIANMKDFPGSSADFVLTTDADLWPLRKAHFYPPRDHCSFLLLHTESNFDFNHVIYKMLPMSNIGANTSLWQQIINTNSSIIANDSASILNYFQQGFGNKGPKPAKFDFNDWYVDQKYVSVRFDEWLETQKSKDVVCRMSDKGLFRFDRASWETENFQIEKYYDAHLILHPYVAQNWTTFQPLLLAMYGNNSWQEKLLDKYATDFYTKFLNHLN